MKPILFAALLLSGCQFLTPEAAALRGFSPLDIPPEQLEAGVALAPGLRLAPDGVRMFATARREDTGEELAETFVFDGTANGALASLTIRNEDFDRFRDFQEQVRAWQEMAPDATSGSMTVTAQLCTGPARLDPDAEVSIWLAA